MKKLNVITGLIFGLLSLVHTVSGTWLAAATSGTLAIGFALSDLAYAPTLAYGAATSTPLPTWRRYGSMLLVGAALLLFSFQVGHDLKAKVGRTNTESPSIR
ncbi:hypothetical protein [Hymenobacter terrenus]|uniref:hypothetical protein n=1 Tax=Hymenobacter terrenus TaxID=1629124 RepID=UPI0006190D62|nr:hypothetical protein [Hymenobacter terrenus]